MTVVAVICLVKARAREKMDLVRTWSDDDPKAGLMARKRAALVDAALTAFLQSGYAESSVNRIAETAGVSIKTLYRHFESKDELFSAVMEAACAKGSALGVPSGSGAAVEPSWFFELPAVGLPLAGRTYLHDALREEQVALYRVVIRDAHRFPELGRRYREAVIGERDALFGRYLDRWQPAMGWTVKDKPGATAAFAALLKVGWYEDVLHGLRAPVEEEIVAQAEEASRRMLILLQVGAL